MNDTFVTIVGNLAEDPRRHDSSAGSPVTSFRVGCVQRRLDKGLDKWVDGPTSWYRVSAFRSLGQHAFESLRKGQRVVVVGKLRLRSWEAGDKQGVAAEIDAEAVGHDLRWGTSAFSPTSGRSVGVGSSAAPVAAEGTVDAGSDEWSAASSAGDAAERAASESWPTAAAVLTTEPEPAAVPF